MLYSSHIQSLAFLNILKLQTLVQPVDFEQVALDYQ